MLILGIGGLVHDASAVLLRDGELLAAVEAEKIIRQRHPGGLPHQAIESCLAIAKVKPEQIDRINPITKVVTRTRKRDVHERRVVRQPVALGADMSPVEAEFYAQVTAAVRKYCSDLDMAEGFLLTIPQRQMCSSMAAACRSWSVRSRNLDDEIDQILWDAFGEDATIENYGGRRPNADSLISQLSRIAREV